MDLAVLQRIKQWHVRHHKEHPVEYLTWDAMLMLWVMGWIGWLPAFVLDAYWATPLCMIGVSAPTLYVSWRLYAHRHQKLRCDWATAI